MELVEENSLAYNIIDCESKWRDWECNHDYGCRAGMGLWGFISGTWNDTLVKMARDDAYMPERCWQLIELPMRNERNEIVFDGECNLLAGIWLLENEGSNHWGDKESSWGSYNCWNHYLTIK